MGNALNEQIMAGQYPGIVKTKLDGFQKGEGWKVATAPPVSSAGRASQPTCMTVSPCFRLASNYGSRSWSHMWDRPPQFLYVGSRRRQQQGRQLPALRGI